MVHESYVTVQSDRVCKMDDTFKQIIIVCRKMVSANKSQDAESKRKIIDDLTKISAEYEKSDRGDCIDSVCKIFEENEDGILSYKLTPNGKIAKMGWLTPKVVITVVDDPKCELKIGALYHIGAIGDIANTRKFIRELYYLFAYVMDNRSDEILECVGGMKRETSGNSGMGEILTSVYSMATQAMEARGMKVPEADENLSQIPEHMNALLGNEDVRDFVGNAISAMSGGVQADSFSGLFGQMQDLATKVTGGMGKDGGPQIEEQYDSDTDTSDE